MFRRFSLSLLLLAACEPKDLGGGGGIGGRIAFSRGGDVWVINDDGASGETRITTTSNTQQPALSPNGQTVAYAQTSGNGSDIWATSVSGGTPRQLSAAQTNGDRAEAPAWSRDGSQLVFHVTSGGNAQLFIVNADGSGSPRLITTPTSASFPSFSADGARLLAVFTSGLGTVPADGSGQLTPITPSGLGQVLSRAVFSPNGARIAFSLPSSGGGHPRPFVMNADGSSPHQLRGTPDGDDTWPSWSFDGSFVAFQSNSGGTDNIYAASVDKDEDPKLLIGDGKTPSWSAR